MNVFNKIFTLFFWAAFIFFITLIAIIIFFDVIQSLKREIIQGGIIAFFGAFFAFIFVKIAEWITIVRRGNVNHFNSLVKIERLLNRIVYRLEKNILGFEGNLGALKSMRLLTWGSYEIPFDYKLADNLKNIDFINEYFSQSLDIETMKNDLTKIKDMYEEIKNLFIIKKINPQIYEVNILYCISQMEEVNKFMKVYQENTLKLLEKTRLLQKEKENNWTFLFGAFPKTHYAKDFNEKTKKELIILKKEIDEIRKKSTEEISKIKSG